MLHPLRSISPIDGRYYEKTEALRDYVSEYAFMRYRVKIEIEWLIFLSQKNIPEIPPLSSAARKKLRNIVKNFTLTNAARVKEIERFTQHDVKAIEYFLKEILQSDAQSHFTPYLAFIHFACTSEDINNLAYALMLKDMRAQILLPELQQLQRAWVEKAHEYAPIAMLARTHGQPATPTTLGKEFANFAARVTRQIDLFCAINITAKFNGATGNFNAHACAYPDLDWPMMAQEFVQHFGLDYNAYTTQIEPHDYIAEYVQALSRINILCIDFARDLWGYIALDYFKQHQQPGQVGSSTMPHKVNPIDFENAEGNLGIANALLHFFAEKLPISRWQRDLSDSTVLRNLGVAIAHTILSYASLQQGIDKISVNSEVIRADLEKHWEILAEPIQIILKKHGVNDAYEQLHRFSQGRLLSHINIIAFIEQIQVAEDIKKILRELSPHNFIGWAEILAGKIK